MAIRTDKNFLDYFEKFALSKDEINSACRNGLLPKNLESLLTYRKDDGYWYSDKTNNFQLAAAGVKYTFRDGTFEIKDGNDVRGTLFLFTDFYLIISLGYSLDEEEQYKTSSGYGVRFSGPLSLLVIPYEKLKVVKFEFYRNFSGAWDAKYAEKDKSVVAGAVVGGLVAGPIGAVVGAAANQGKKKQVIVSPSGSYNDDHYNLKIQAIDMPSAWIEHDCFKVHKGQTQYIDIFNQNMEKALALSKEKLSDEEKQKIVQSSVNAGQKEKTLANVGAAAVMIVICVIAVAFYSFVGTYC